MYGQLQSERLAEENQICRQIVREISLFGITERQRLLVIYLLAMEIEDAERMRAITTLVKDLAGQELFLSGRAEEGPNGTPDV
jgi:hypothetical protein